MRYDPLRSDEIAGVVEAIRRTYTQQKVDQGGWDTTDAEAAADEELAGLLPGGRLLPGHEILLLRPADSGPDAVPVGHLWIGVLRQMPATLYVFDLAIRSQARGNGWGASAMEFAERRARELGCSSIALHVFGGNTRAIDLYRRLGYQVTDLTMKKVLAE